MPPRECNPDYCSPLTTSVRRRRRRQRQLHRHRSGSTSPPSPSCLSPSSSSQDPTRRRQRRRKLSSRYSVRFATGSDLVEVHPYFREPYNTTAAIRNAIWYNHDDFQTFKDECRQDAIVVVDDDDDAIVNEDGNDDTSLVVCTRGIERMTKEACQKYQNHRTVLIGEIALFQRRFKGKNECSSGNIAEEDLAKILSERTSHDVKEAQLRAEQDQEFALQYLKEEEEESSSSSSLDDGTTTRKRISTIGGTIREEIENTIIHHGRSSSAYYSYHCRLTPFAPSNSYNSSSSSSGRRNHSLLHSSPTNGGNIIIQSRRKLRARTSKLFREEHLHRLMMEGL